MIILHRLNGQEFVLNASQIETVEAKPDTTITLINEKMYIVKESLREVINLVIDYHGKIHTGENHSNNG
jgi:flagellar protein FlbD